MSEQEENNEEQLLRALGAQSDEPVLPQNYVAKAGRKLADDAPRIEEKDIIEALKTVCDPEIMIDIYNLGLVYKIEPQEHGNVAIEMTLTAPTCPVAGVLPQQAADAVAAIKGAGEIEVKVVWEPAWSIEKMSQDAKDMMELL